MIITYTQKKSYKAAGSTWQSNNKYIKRQKLKGEPSKQFIVCFLLTD